MIQRIQTLLLLGTVIISLLLMYLPVFELMPAVSDPSKAEPTRAFVLSANALLVIVNLSVGVLSFFNILLYKRRNIQLRICRLSMLLICALVGLLFFLSDSFSSGMDQRVHYTYGIYLPLIQLVFVFAAMRYIKRDEDLVRSADRLR